MRLDKNDLRDRIIRAVETAGASVSFWGKPHQHPFKLILDYNGESRKFLIYIWNITHGGGTARATDEYRIQITSVPSVDRIAGTTTLLLGYSQSTNVFAGWDASQHTGAVAYSPSLQVKENALLSANEHGVSIYPKSNHEVVICCQPDFLAEYAFTCESMHGYTTPDVQDAVNAIVLSDPENEVDIPIIQDDRQRVLKTQALLHRAHDFRRRVVAAYQRTCAVSGTQLGLVDAAHILPVSVEGSHDGTSNGICLEATYHRAFDQGLIVVMPDYTIGINMIRINRLTEMELSGGFDRLMSGLRIALDLPVSKTDRPNPNLISAALASRNIEIAQVRSVSSLRGQ